MNALGMIEVQSIPLGVNAGDAMLKAATVQLVTAQPVCAGKYIVIVTGEVSAVSESVAVVHVISTDTHSLDKRPPRMAEAAAVLEKELGRETASKLLQNGDALFDDEELDVFTPRRPKKFLNFWM